MEGVIVTVYNSLSWRNLSLLLTDELERARRAQSDITIDLGGVKILDFEKL